MRSSCGVEDAVSLGKGRDEVIGDQQMSSKARSGGDGVAGDSEMQPRRRTCSSLPCGLVAR